MFRMWRLLAFTIAALITAVAAVGPASPVFAHDPIFLTDDQTTPDTGPYLPDGAISWAIYGTFPEAGQTRGFEFDLRDGDDLFVGLLIPNLEPELSLPDPELPYAELTMPDGEVRSLEAEIREIFDEQFSQTSYVTLVEIKEPAVAGRHSIVVYSRAPSRFVVAVGEREVFFTEADRAVDRPSDFLGIAEPLNAWYQTPPGEDVAAAGEPEDDVQIDVEAVEAELDALAEESAATTVPEEAVDELPIAAGDDAATSGIAESGPADDTDDDTSDAADNSENVAEVVEEADDPTVAADENMADVDETADDPTVAAGEPETAIDDMTGDDDSSGLAWVIPLAIVVAAAGGVGFWLAKRRSEAA